MRRHHSIIGLCGLCFVVGCATTEAVKGDLSKISKAPDPFFGPKDYIPPEKGLAKTDEPPGTGRGANGPTSRVGPSVDLRSNENKQGNGVTVSAPSTLGKSPATLTGGDPTRKANNLSIDTPPGATRIDPSVRRMNWSIEDGGWEQAQAGLKARGVSWQRLEMTSEGHWEFECFVPDPKDPDRGQGYRAKGPSELSAVKAVLEQIEAPR